MAQLDDAFMSARPPIPALNRWSKLHPPLIWWLACLTLLGGVVARAVLKVASENRKQEEEHLLAEGAADAEAGTAPTSEKEERRKVLARWKIQISSGSQEQPLASLCKPSFANLPWSSWCLSFQLHAVA